MLILKNNLIASLSTIKHFWKPKFENKDLFNVIMPSGSTKILEFNLYQKSDKVPFNIYADLESIIEKIVGCKNIP